MNVYEENQMSGNMWPVPSGMEGGNSVQDRSISTEPWNQTAVFQEFEAQVAQHESEHKDALNKLRRYYIMPDDGAVTDFLNQHRSLSLILLEAVPRLKAHFGSNVIFSLRSPVDGWGSRTLYAVVMWPGTAEAARRILDAFDDGWWGPNSGGASAYLSFTYELV